MKITNVSVPVRDSVSTANFFRRVLGLPVTADRAQPVITVGYTRIELVESPEMTGVHHLAMTIPTHKFAEAKRWLEQRVPLLRHEGADEFETAPSWNARSLYFDGPEGAILEVIERRDLDNATPGPFSSDDLLGVSEVGVAVPDVRTLVHELEADAGVAAYGTGSFDDFAPVGTVDGLLILVAPGRPWFPSPDRMPSVSPIEISALGPQSREIPLGFGSRLRLSTRRANIQI